MFSCIFRCLWVGFSVVIGKPVYTPTDVPISQEHRVLVVGAGAVGLRTALELARRGVDVVLRAPRHPIQDSCSVGAGGLWMPFHCDDPRVDKWALETLDELVPQAAESSDQTLPLVEIITKIVLHRTSTPPNELPAWSRYERLEFQHLSVEELSSQNAAIHGFRIPPLEELVDAGYRFAWMFQTPVVNTARMLESFLHELENDHGANVNVETGQVYESLSQLQETAKELECQAIVNCAGMGARQLVPDPQVVPARGVLYRFKRKDCPRRPEISEPLQSLLKPSRDAAMTVQEAPWGNETHPAYMIPRGADLVVGGTYLEGDEERSIRPQEREHLLQSAHHFGIDVSSCRPIGEWVGFRPYRNPVRCEFDSVYNGGANTIPIFHSCGHGGSGWSVNVGAAKECADKLLGYFDNQCHDATHGVPSSGLPSSAGEI